MNKSTLIITVTAIVCFTVLAVVGEYLTYKYYASLAAQSAIQQNQALSSSSAFESSKGSTAKKSSEKMITSFNFEDPMAIGSIDQSSHTITITVPPITDITKLTPTISISKNARIFPASGVQQDFTGNSIYTVTAQDGSTQKYGVTVNVASIMKSAEKLIISFKLSGLTPEVVGNIDSNAHTVYAVVPDGTDITKITPTIVVSDGATVSPQSGATQDFTNPLIYVVTDMYGGIQNYTITVVTESNSG
ncbi:MAG: DUF5018 domain-containing protein [Candidatus Staskawiczbacteria bacterium]|nr:DUF5018 domain-containing protein [Candidatus Staskawiczbacteria bacterium]